MLNHSQVPTPAKSTTCPPRTKKLVRIWHPHIRDTPITNAEELYHLINDQYPGITRNPQFFMERVDLGKRLLWDSW